MFESAIEQAARFTTGIHTIDRTFGRDYARPGAATMFFVNERGFAVTCKHVASLIPFADEVAKRFGGYKARRELLSGYGSNHKQLKELAAQHGFDANALCEMLIQIQGIGSFSGVTVHMHPTYDLAILEFLNLQQPNRPFARFINDDHAVKQGAMLCRLGFPFPEFTNFQYAPESDSMSWTTTGNTATPYFPIDGMVTRFLGDAAGVWGIEMSTPGLKGQSGGPLFNKDGVVCGMQSATAHLHLGFDTMNKEIISNGEKIKVTNQPFLHVGHCVHAKVIKDFLREKGVKYYVAD